MLTNPVPLLHHKDPGDDFNRILKVELLYGEPGLRGLEDDFNRILKGTCKYQNGAVYASDAKDDFNRILKALRDWLVHF